MSKGVKISNKSIVVNDRNYRLTIRKQRQLYTSTMMYVCYLSDVNSQFTADIKFRNIEELETGLRLWIVRSNELNNPETRILNRIKEWDGVIET